MPEVGETGDARSDIRGGLPVGTALNGYELKSILGKGGFGITYRARDLTLGRDVAIKEYLPTSLALREGRTTVLPISTDHAEQFAWGRERFLDEARTLARLDDTTGIVRVYDFLEANGTAYMVMALIEGETLIKRLLRERRLTPEAVDRLIPPLLEGLEEVHAAGFLHRDIKPANIMLDARGRPTLIDFGASRAAMAERSTTLTAVFTPGYAAAEQFAAGRLGPWSDIYGLAATLYHAITGRIPPSAIERILKDTYEPLIELKPEGFAPELLAWIDRGLALRVDDRPQSIAEWRALLDDGKRDAASSSSAATQVARKPGALKRAAKRTGDARLTLRGPTLWSAAVAAILLLIGGGYFAWQATLPTTRVEALSTVQLEEALAERRKAEALATEKRQLEEEARQKAAAEAEANRQAEAELERARAARQKAEEDLAKLKADIEAQRKSDTTSRGAETAMRRAAEEAAQSKAEDEAAGLRLAEEAAKKKAAEDAETKHKADEALARAEAERQRAEQEARAKAEAEAAARRQSSEETQRKAAEAESKRQAEEAEAKAKAETAERALRLEQADRERLQIALTSLGFDTRGSDGIFGPRSREMIATWQKTRNHPATGFLTASQQQALLKEAESAVAKYDEKKKAEEEAKVRPATTPAASTGQASRTPASASSPLPNGLYSGAIIVPSSGQMLHRVSVEVTNGNGKGTASYAYCGSAPIAISVDPSGAVSGELSIFSLSCNFSTYPISGRVEGDRLLLSARIAASGGVLARDFTLTRVTQSSGGSGSPALPSPDGSWRGTYGCGDRTSLTLDMQVANGSSSWTNPNPTAPQAEQVFDIQVSLSSTQVGAVVTYVPRAHGSGSNRRLRLSGQYSGDAIRAVGRDDFSRRDCTLALTRVP